MKIFDVHFESNTGWFKVRLLAPTREHIAPAIIIGLNMKVFKFHVMRERDYMVLKDTLERIE